MSAPPKPRVHVKWSHALARLLPQSVLAFQTLSFLLLLWAVVAEKDDTFCLLQHNAIHTAGKALDNSEVASWDYVVAGAGNAGLVVATRLALANYSVLVVETGKDITPEGRHRGDTGCSSNLGGDDPSMIAKMRDLGLTYDRDSKDCPKPFFSPGWNPQSTQGLTASEHSRMITTEPLLHGQRQWQYQTSVGNTAGGSTVTNGKVFGRHPIEDYELFSKWVDHWGSDNMAPYYNKPFSVFKPNITNLRSLDEPAFAAANGPIELTRPMDHVDPNAVPNVNPDAPESNLMFDIMMNHFKPSCLKAYGLDADIRKDEWPGAAEGCSNQWFATVDRHGKVSDATNYFDKLLSQGQLCTEAPVCKNGACAPNPACPVTTRVTVMYETLATKVLFDPSPSPNAAEPRAWGIEVTSEQSRERALHPTKSIWAENCVKMGDPSFNKWSGSSIPGVIGGGSSSLLFSTNRSYPLDFETPYYSGGDDVGIKHEIRVNKEVILAAGAFNSPKILSLSGVGPRQDLEEVGVDVLVDSPVGANIADHPEVSIGVAFDRPMTTPTDDYALKAETLLRTSPEVHHRYLGHMGTGVATNVGGLEGKAEKSIDLDQHTASTLREGGDLDYHMHILFTDNFQNYDPASSLPRWNSSSYGGIGFLCEGSFNHGSGKMRVKSKSPKDPLSWEPPFATHHADVAAVVACAKMADKIRREMEDSLSMKLTYVSPWSGVDFDDVESIANVVRQLMWGHHPHGGCRMGRSRLDGGVVDWRGRVFGVQGVRVVDASVFPRFLHGNPQSQVYVAAERFADLIIEDS